MPAGKESRPPRCIHSISAAQSSTVLPSVFFLAPLADVYVYAEDRPGFLLRLVQTLYEGGLSIKDIELLKIREGTGGAFRFGFATAPDADRAVAAFTEAGYTAYRL